MTRDEVLATYDVLYARRYDESFLLTADHGFLAKTQFEIDILRRLTEPARRWLDVGCGTGYFLRHGRGNPELECAGLDLSPAMLAEARRRNPDAQLVEGDFLRPHSAFVERWDVTSCMWGAYGLQETVADVEALVANLASWTRRGGRCFMPVFDLDLFEERRVRGVLIEGVEIDLLRYCWTFTEPDGKRHRAMLAPPVAVMTAMFERHFGAAESFPYPVSPGQADGLPIVGIVAHRRNER